MIAHIGDRVVLEGIHLGGAPRVGVITEIPHADGAPPYQVPPDTVSTHLCVIRGLRVRRPLNTP